MYKSIDVLFNKYSSVCVCDCEYIRFVYEYTLILFCFAEIIG